MKAIVYEHYGPPDVLTLRDIPRPVPKAREVLVKVVATTVTIGDTIMRSLKMPIPPWQQMLARVYLGIRKPKRPVLGMELAGIIEAVGDQVTRFKVGDPVIASTFSVNYGGHAEYKCMPADGMIIRKPARLSFTEAAAVPGGGMTALRCLQNGGIKRGQSVLIYGASGAVGTNAVQLARYFGADVTGVCSTANLDMVRSLGADRVIDYTREDLTGAYDIVFDAVGKLSPARAKILLKPGGVYLNVLTASGSGEKREDLEFLSKIIESGHLRPVIDRCYPLEQIVEAHRYVEEGHKKGNVAIIMAGANS